MKKIATFNSRRYTAYLRCFSEKWHYLFFASSSTFTIYSLKDLCIIYKTKAFYYIDEVEITQDENYLLISATRDTEKGACDCYLFDLNNLTAKRPYTKLDDVTYTTPFTKLPHYDHTILLSLKNKIVLYDCAHRKQLAEIPEIFPRYRTIYLSEAEGQTLIGIYYSEDTAAKVQHKQYILKNNNFTEVQYREIAYEVNYSRSENLKILRYRGVEWKNSALLIIENRKNNTRYELKGTGTHVWYYKVSRSEKYLWLLQDMKPKENTADEDMFALLINLESMTIVQCMKKQGICWEEFNYDEELNYITANDCNKGKQNIYSRVALYQPEKQDMYDLKYEDFTVESVKKFDEDDTECVHYILP